MRQRRSHRGFRMRSACGSPLRNDGGKQEIVIPDGRAANGAAEPEPTRCSGDGPPDGYAAMSSPFSALSISAAVSATPYSAANDPKRGPWDWPSSTSYSALNQSRRFSNG